MLPHGIPYLRVAAAAAVALAMPAAGRQATPTLAALVAETFPLVRDGVTVATWTASHPGTDVTPRQPGLFDGEFCARSRTTVRLDDGSSAELDVRFYPPDAPPSLALPVASPYLVRQCRAGMIWIAVHDLDTARTDRRRQVTDSLLTLTLGPAERDAKLAWDGSAEWISPTMRDTGKVSIVVAAKHGEGHDTAQVFAALLARRTGASMRDGEFMMRELHALDGMHGRNVRSTDETFAIANLPATASAGMRRFQKIFEPDSGEPPPLSPAQRDTFAITLARWLKLSTTLPPARRAAALFVAHAVFSASQYSAGWFEPADSAFRQRMTSLGADFVSDQLGGGFDYADSWLTQAWHTAPGSRAGEIAFLRLVDEGFETNSTCSAQHGDGYRAVIAQGTAYVKRYPQSAIVPQLHLRIAQAYGDIVTLAAGGGYQGDVDTTVSGRAEAGRARVRAITEYRVAIATLTDSAARNEAWRSAWRLLAGLAPEGTMFNCIND